MSGVNFLSNRRIRCQYEVQKGAWREATAALVCQTSSVAETGEVAVLSMIAVMSKEGIKLLARSATQI